jgi:hypothetical protein
MPRVNVTGLRSRVLLVLTILAAAAMAACSDSDSSGTDVPAPSGLSYASPQTFAVGSPIDPLDPTVTGEVSSYSVAPTLPAGLAIDSTSGEISGTPTAATAPAAYTVTAENESGSTTFELTITVAGVDVASGDVSRFVVLGTSIAVKVLLQPQYFGFAGTLHAGVTGAEGVFLPGVEVANDGDTYVLTLATDASADQGSHAGSLVLELCADAACDVRQLVESVPLSYEITVMSSAEPWPGDNLTALAAWPGVPDWKTFQGNSAHTGHVPAAANPDQFSTRWRSPAVPLWSGFYTRLGTPVAENGRFFIAGGNVLYARSEFDGQTEWEYDFSGLDFPSVNPPAVADGVVYVAAGQQSSTFMYAFQADDGALVFKSPMNSQWEHYLAPTVGEHGVYTNAGTYGGLFAFAPTGEEMFFAFMDQTSSWTPAVDATGVYAYTGGILQVLDPTNGTVLDSITDPSFVNYTYEIGGSPVLGTPGSVIVANYVNARINVGGVANWLMRFDIAQDKITWQVDGAYSSTPAYSGGIVYAANETPLRLEARDEADGTLLWSWVPPLAGDTRFDSEVLVTDNLAFVSTNLATYAIDLANHRAAWSYPQPGRLALTQSGILYIHDDTWLTAINLK